MQRPLFPRLSTWSLAALLTVGVACASGSQGTTGEGASGGSGPAGSAGATGAGGVAGSSASGQGGRGGSTGGSTGGASPADAGSGSGGSPADGGGTDGGGRGGAGGAGGAAGQGGAGGGTGGAGGSPIPGLPAFPGADGAGALVKGGRGGTVYHVTRLDTDYSDMTPGTLRYGLTMLTGPRTIVFDVSGVISMGRTAVAGWDSNGNGWDTASRMNIPADVTIAGQTAPGPIILMGGTVKPGGTNIILRNVTFAPGYGNRSFDEPTRVPAAGDFPDSYTYDALDISGQDLIIDHVTAIYGSDETVSMNELANNITIQYCTIAQGQNYPQADAEASTLTYTGHSLGSLFQAGSNAKVSVIHNLYAHLKGRLPRVGTEATALTMAGVGAYNDFRNNVFYNWLGTAGTGASGQASQNNFINNFYLAGPGGDNPVGGASTALTTSAGGTAIFNGSDAAMTKVFHAGNLKDTNHDGDASDGVALANADFGSSAFQPAAFTQTPYYGVTAAAAAAYANVLDVAGARWWSRAAVDARIINETRTGTGKIVAWADDPFNDSAQEGTEWRALRATPLTTRPAGFDTDNDGMPDAWEAAHGLDPNVADNNGDFDNDGYTNLEEYINEIAAWPALAAVMFEGARSTRYADILNWTLDPRADASPGGAKHRAPPAAHWQPSRYDVARITRGTAVIDAVGQHAGTLQVGAAGPARAAGVASAATLDVTGGWLDVANRVEIGGGGAVRLSGGALVTPALLKTGAGGRFDFTGGTLRAGRVGFDLVASGGTIAPGAATARALDSKLGRTDVLANLIIDSGALAIDVDGAAAGVVSVAGSARLGGALELRPARGFVPRPGQSWTVLVAKRGIRGRFASVTPGYSASVVGNRLVVTFDARRAVSAVRARARARARSG